MLFLPAFKIQLAKVELGDIEAPAGSDVTGSTKQADNMERSADMEIFSDDSVVNTSGGSTSFDDSHEGDIELGVRPYQFEPEVDTDEEISLPNSPDRHVERLGNNDW